MYKRQEEAITGQHCPTCPLPGSVECDPGGSHTIHLTSTHPKTLTVFGNDDGIGTHVPDQLPSESKIVPFACGRDPLCRHGPFIGIHRLIIEVLHQKTTKNAAHVVTTCGFDRSG